MAENIRNLTHILLTKTQAVFDYQKPKRGMDKESGLSKIPKHDNPSSHGGKLLSDLQAISDSIESEDDLPETAIITFRGEGGKDFIYDSLDNRRELKIKLLSIKKVIENGEALTIANVQFLNKDSFKKFSKILENYGSNSLGKRGGGRKKTIDCTSGISNSSLENLFFDDLSLFPKDDEKVIWWELMIDGEISDNFINIAKELEIQHDEGFQMSDDRFVVLIKANKAQLLKLRKKYPYIAEIKTYKKIVPRSVIEFSREEQEILKDDILSRTTHLDDAKASVVIFDSGINQGHPLIKPFLREEDNKSFKVEWGSFDHLTSPHGTAMSGLVLYGNINDLVGKSDEIKINTTLKGVKIFNQDDESDVKSYSIVTNKAFELSECQKNKAYVMAVTSSHAHNGEPSEWSSCIDEISFDNNSLFLISAGNVKEHVAEDGWGSPLRVEEYDSHQKNSCIENPAQAWNAISVGAYTEIADHNLLKSDVQAPHVNSGDLSPYSRTSIKFDDKWPIKPDVLFEGGNRVVENGVVMDNPNLHPVSCEPHYQSGDNKLFCSINATSAATALAGKFVWELMAQYPSFWPETIRGLMVHSAEWTSAMQDKIPLSSSKTRLLEGLRCFGYGVPNIQKARYSAKNSLTLIAQHEFLLYKNHQDPKNKSRIPQTFEFDLPWPKEVLQNELANKDVRVKITLSYFIEPNASNRGYEKDKYRYQSYGLRFEIKKPEDSLDEFRKNYNQKVREEDYKKDTSAPGLEWLYGANSRNKGGSIHKDILRGINGAKLAEMNKIAIYPTKGWWQENKKKKTEDMKVRFSLLVDIETDEVNIDLYNNIKNIIETPIKI